MPDMQPPQNPYGGLPMGVGSMLEFGATRANPLMRLTTPANLPFTGNPAEIRQSVLDATNTPNIIPRAGAGFYETTAYKPNSILTPLEESRLQRAIKICEAVKTDDCSAFDKEDFAANCIMSHLPGTNSVNKKQSGGFVLFDKERKEQLEGIRIGALANMQPLIGTIPVAAEGKSQYVSYDKKSCQVMKEVRACETQAAYGVANCAKCYDSRGNWYRVGPEAQRQSGAFVVSGKGSVVKVLDSKGKVVGEGPLTTEPRRIELPGDAEGQNFSIIVAGTEIGGFLEGPTISGRSRTDLIYLISADTEGNSAKPNMRGRVMVGNEPVSKIVPATGKTMMNLTTYVPFTFLNSDEPSARLCSSAPFIGTDRSATFLAADKCYNGSAPGKQDIACLQDRFVRAGCLAKGNMYPSTEAIANDLRFDANGNPQAIFDITSRITDMSLMAQTGNDLQGKPLDADPSVSLANWDKVSQACTGVPIATPCDGAEPDGPVSLACMQFLYNNKGGNTYSSRPIDKFASARVGNDAVRCTPDGAAYPKSEDDAAFQAARNVGGVVGLKTYFDGLHNMANNNELSDVERADAMKKCYGIDFAPDSRTSEGFYGGRVAGFEGSIKPTLREGYASASANTMLSSDLGTSSYRGVGRNNFLSGGQNSRFQDTPEYRASATFNKVNPVCGAPGYMSLQPSNKTDMLLTNINGKVMPFDIGTAENKILAQNNSCWREVQGQCATPAQIRLESKSYPGQFMISRGNDIFLDTPTQAGDQQGSCWDPTQPLTTPGFMPQALPAMMEDYEIRNGWNLHDDGRTWGANPSYETNPSGAATWQECAKRALAFKDRNGVPANGFVFMPERSAPGQNCRIKMGGYFQNRYDVNWAPLISGKIKENA